MFRRMQQWYLIPALIFLVLTLISGTWLRLQWAWPQWELPELLMFRTDFLIHGHSHVALLGWVFLGLAGFVLEAGTRQRRLPLTGLTLLGGFTAVLTLLMFVAFVREGYAPSSIALSTVHMLAGYIFAWIFFRNARTDNNTGSRYFLEGAVFWMVMATAGTWLLAAGRGLPPFWMNVAVQYYLHVLFNGWFLFALAGLAFRYVIAPRFRRTQWPFWLMMAGLLPSLIPHLEIADAPVALMLLGALGTLLFAAGGMGVIVLILCPGTPNVRSADNTMDRTADSKANKTTGKKTDKMTDNMQNACGVVNGNRYRFLLWPGLISAVFVLLLPVAMAWPDFRSIWLQSDFLVIGYIHLHLLLTVSTLMVFGLLRIHRYEQRKVAFTTHPNRNTTLPAVLFVTGSVLMVVILFTTGWHQVQGSIPPYPIQETLFFTGLLTTLGAVWLAGLLIPGLVSRKC